MLHNCLVLHVITWEQVHADKFLKILNRDYNPALLLGVNDCVYSMINGLTAVIQRSQIFFTNHQSRNEIQIEKYENNREMGTQNGPHCCYSTLTLLSPSTKHTQPRLSPAWLEEQNRLTAKHAGVKLLVLLLL